MPLCSNTDTRKRNVDKCLYLRSPSFLLFYSLLVAIIFSFYILHFSSSPIVNSTSKEDTAPRNHYYDKSELCDLFTGSWIPQEKGSLYYTHISCPTIPFTKNCLIHGRPDKDFMYWRWKPDKCTLPRFNSKSFLTLFKGKTMAFIGDSLAGNPMDSLLCLLSSEESPTNIHKDVEEKSRTWNFPRHNFTLMLLRANFLVFAKERVIDGLSTAGFDLHLDKFNECNWTQHLPNIDYAIFSAGHWFRKPSYLYENDNLIGCISCGEVGVEDLDPAYAIKRALQASFKYINECNECTGIVVVLTTFTVPHFEHGAWHEKGHCNWTRPFTREEVKVDDQAWEFRNIQIEEFERARKDGEKIGNIFEIMDVTRAMSMRPDGHPGKYWGHHFFEGINDCLHWCMPGPIDTWNEFLLEILRRKLPTLH